MLLTTPLGALVPVFDVREYHDTVVQASAADALAAARAMPAAEDPIVRVLFWIRRIPGGELPLERFIGQVGFDAPISDGRALAGVWVTSGLRLGFAIWSEPLHDGRARLATETRVQALGLRARIGFRLYWLVVGPFSALIRRRWLAAARRRAESAIRP